FWSCRFLSVVVGASWSGKLSNISKQLLAELESEAQVQMRRMKSRCRHLRDLDPVNARCALIRLVFEHRFDPLAQFRRLLVAVLPWSKRGYHASGVDIVLPSTKSTTTASSVTCTPRARSVSRSITKVLMPSVQ